VLPTLQHVEAALVRSHERFNEVDGIVLKFCLAAGHTHGLGPFGGPNTNEPFKLQPNGTVFDPEAVMNPFYLGGEKRNLFPTDISALHTMYASQSLE
jgi:hypothetical protein